MDLTPHAKTLTRRKDLAHTARKILDRYRHTATQQANRPAIVDLLEAEAAIQRLLALESGGAFGNLHADVPRVMRDWKVGRPANPAWVEAQELERPTTGPSMWDPRR